MASMILFCASPFSSPWIITRSGRRKNPASMCARHGSNGEVTVLDYGAGNVRSLQNAIESLGFNIHWVNDASDIRNASKLIFPGVGSFGAAMHNLNDRGYVDALTDYLKADRPFLGICLGLHTLFEGSEESPGVPGLGILPGTVGRFRVASHLKVPHIGWNLASPTRDSILLAGVENKRYYFVHSFRLRADDVERESKGSVLATTLHGEEYVAVLQRGHLCATQFHPEKSGSAGLRLLDNFLRAEDLAGTPSTTTAFSRVPTTIGDNGKIGLAKRVVACLDVRENDAGDLVVTKGDQYDVRDKEGGHVRNLGKPVELAERYYNEGADEVCFLNITSFRGEPVSEAPMLEVLRRVSRRVFVPLCIGGGIRDYIDKEGVHHSALDVAATYFRAGADKVSLGSDAVYAAERYYASGMDGASSIETISHVYGAQAVVVSIDPRRVYLTDGESTRHNVLHSSDGKKRFWYQCTVKGGREGRDIDAVELAVAAQKLGAGEILLNCMDEDGQKNGYDHELIRMVRSAVSIPVIASSGAGKASHFTDCFDVTEVEAALAAGIFHRGTVTINEVKQHMFSHGTPVRR